MKRPAHRVRGVLFDSEPTRIDRAVEPHTGDAGLEG